MARSAVTVCRTSSRWPTMTRPISRSMAVARSAKASGREPRALPGLLGRAVHLVLRDGRGWAAPGCLPGWVERAEVVAHVVLDGQRHVPAIEGRQGVLVEFAVDLRVRHVGAGIRARALLVALGGLPGAAGTGDVGRVPRQPEPVERGKDAADLVAELGRPVGVHRAAECAFPAGAGAEIGGVRAAAADRAATGALAALAALSTLSTLTLALTLSSLATLSALTPGIAARAGLPALTTLTPGLPLEPGCPP